MWSVIHTERPGLFDLANHTGRLGVAHVAAKALLARNREVLWRDFSKFKSLQTIEVDVTNTCCPVGCCRVMELEWNMFKSGIKLKEIRILGLHNATEETGLLDGMKTCFGLSA